MNVIVEQLTLLRLNQSLFLSLKWLFRCLLIISVMSSPGIFYAQAQAQDSSCGWATAKKWKAKMHLTQVQDKQGVLASGDDCTANYTLALNHVSDVTGEFSSTGTEGAYQGSLTSQEVVNNTMDIIFSGEPECTYGDVYFTEVGSGPGSEENVSFSIDPAMGKYVISFPHTGFDCPVVYSAPNVPPPAGPQYYEGILRKEINGDFLIDYPGMVLASSPSDPVTTFEGSLPGGSLKTITGETTFPHSQYPEVLVTWSWELTPDTGESDSELGSPEGKGKAGGGSYAPDAGYGEPVWTVNMANLNIFVTDTPLWYRNPIGPSVEVTLSYNSQAGAGRFEPIGRNWQLNYESYLSAGDVTSDTGEIVHEVTIIMLDGRKDVYTYDSLTGRFTPPYRCFNELRVIRQGELMEGSDYELTFPDGMVYVYKVPTGSLLWAFLHEIRDPYGNKLSLQWEGQSPWGGRLQRITDAMGRFTTFFHDSDNRISSVFDPFGRQARFEYDDQGNLTRIVDMGGYATTFSYDACGNMQSMILGSNSVYFERDAAGMTVRDNMGTERFDLDLITGVASYRGANAEAGATYGYTQSPAQDGSNQKDITHFQTPEGVSYNFTHDQKGNLLTDTMNAATGNETSEYRYNTKGKVTYIKNPRGAITNLTYASNNVDLIELQNGLGSITATYNGRHDIETLTNRQGKTKVFNYNIYGQIEYTIDNLGILTDFIYNANHQLHQIVRAGILVAAYEYDHIGRVNAYTDANGYTLRYAYNNLDDLLSITYPDNTATTFTRSPSVPHLLDSATDQALRKTEYKYNAHKQLREIYDPKEGYTRFTSDSAGNIKELVDPNTNSTSFGYNKDNQITSKTLADGRLAAGFSYTNRRLTWSRNARSIETRYTYDRNGNLLTIQYSDATPGVTMEYDDFNRPIRIEDGLGVHVRTYDANSRPKTIDGPWANDTLAFVYDALGRRTSLALENGPTVTYSYDALHRLTTVAGNGLAYTYSYQGGANLLEKTERPDGSRTEYAYDAVMKRLQGLTNRDRSGAILNEYTFAFDVLGQPTAETVTNGPDLQFADIAAAAYTYNNLNQAVTMDGSETVFSYDADGNMTRGLTGDGMPFVAAYDAENRMISIQFTDTSGTARRQEFSYGSNGFLGIRKDFEGGVLTAEQRYIWDSGKMLQVRNGANSVERDFLWGIAKAGGVGALLALIQGGQTYQYYSNPRGDITAVLDSAGATVAVYAYDPFGVPLAAAGTLNQPMRFSTKAYDEGTGLYYYGYRFYSPQLGRWLSRDPLSETGSINLYSFSSNNPITRFDPYGAADRDIAREEAAQRLAELDAAVAAHRKERGDPESGAATSDNKKVEAVKEIVEKGLKDKLIDTVCGFLPVCKNPDKPELTVGKSVGVGVNDVEVVSVGAEVGVGINETENPTARGPLFTLRGKVDVKVLNKFGTEAEFNTELGDVSSTPTGARFMNREKEVMAKVGQ